MIVITGESEADCLDLANNVCSSWGVADHEVSLVSEKPSHGLETVSFNETDRLLGRTRSGIIYCAHQSFDPNALAAALGTVRGGGVFVLCCPPLNTWTETTDTFTQTLVVPPYSTEDLSFFFRRRFTESLKEFRGIAIFDADTNRVIDDGITNPAPHLPEEQNDAPVSCEPFSQTAVATCRTRDQRLALEALASLVNTNTPVVLTADRGRGKSAALGIAAAEYARLNHDVLVTAPRARNVQAVFTHAGQVLETMPECTYTHDSGEKEITVGGAGTIWYAPPEDAAGESPDVLLVDEAAGIGLPFLQQFLTVERVAFSTTTHGYEGTGQRFAVTFQPHLEEVREDVKAVRLDEPIRYASTDPLEPWLFHTLLLNASEAPQQAVRDATLETVEYKTLRPKQLSENEPLFRQVYGLLNYAHYKTEPSDLARILDAPNLTVRAVLHDEFVVAVALLADEGNLDEDTGEGMYDGDRIRGNVIPDLLTSQLRDKSAGSNWGLRIVRIATHSDHRQEGLGSYLLRSIREEFSNRKDWLGTSFSATADLVSFWEANGYGSVHLSIRRNQTTGSHSVIMLQGVSENGRKLCSRHSNWFAQRLLGLVTGAYRTIDPDVLIEVIRSIDTAFEYELSSREQTYLSGSVSGPGTYDHNPLPFRKLGLNYFLTTDSPRLDPELERFIILRLLQDKPWDQTPEFSRYQSEREYHQQIPEILDSLLPKEESE